MRMLAVVLVGALSACNGGGGDSSSPTTPAAVTDPNLSVQVKAPLANFNSQSGSRTFTVNGSASGSGTWVQYPQESATLDGVQVLKSVRHMTGTLNVNGAAHALVSTSTRYIDPASYMLLGVDEGRYVKYSTYNLPTAVKAGDTGIVGAAELWESANTTNIHTRNGRTEVFYSVAPFSASSLLFTISVDEYSTQGCTGVCITYYDASTVFSYRKAHSDVTYRIDTLGGASIYSTRAITYTGLEKSGGAVLQDMTFTFQ